MPLVIMHNKNDIGRNYTNRESTVRSLRGSSIRYLKRHSVPVYHSMVVDLRHLRTVHSVEHYPCLPDPQRISGIEECGAVHYGYCVPVVLEDCEEGVGRIKVDPVHLLSSPELDGNLRNMVGHFVARDKVHQQHLLRNGKSSPGSTSSGQSSPSHSSAPQSPLAGLGRLSVSPSPSNKVVDKTSPPSPNRAPSRPDWIKQGSSTTAPSGTTSPKPLAENGITAKDHGGHNKVSVEETLGQLLLDLKASVMPRVDVKNDSTRSAGSVLGGNGSGTNVTSSSDLEISGTASTGIDDRLKTSLGPPSIQVGNEKLGSLDPTVDPVGTLLTSNMDKTLIGTVTSSTSRYNQGELCLQSPVDFAKKRFQWTQDAQAQKKLDAVATRVPLNGIPHLVSETKTRFENGLFNQVDVKWKTEWLPVPSGSHSNVVPDLELNPMLLHPDSGIGHSGRGTTSPRKSPSPEPGVTGSTGAPLPHPKLTSIQKQHIRERALSPTGGNALSGPGIIPGGNAFIGIGGLNSNGPVTANAANPATGGFFPVRPFLTKGSVAERVLIFERCPVLDRGVNRTHQHHPAKPLFNTWRTAINTSYVSPVVSVVNDVIDVDGSIGKQVQVQATNNKENREPYKSPRSSNQRHHSSPASSRQRNLHVPKFYYPAGQPLSSNEIESQLQNISEAFSKFEGQRVSKANFGIVTKACRLPLYWKVSLFIAAGGESKGYVARDSFLEYWRRLVSACHDDASKFVRILSKSNRNYLVAEDFIPLIQDVIEAHPGLTFLKEASEFHSRYVHTVIARIFYCINRSWSGRITIPELRKSNFLQVVAILEEEEDINQITEYFSYEHFYVIYCKFWELDKDHDLLIDREDLSRHNDSAISSRMISRIFSGAVTRGKFQAEGKMTYAEFVWFLLSEEDKRHPTSIEYWFRCMDLDGDGFLSMYELEYFYEEQLQRMEALGLETLPFTDCLCQMLDMIQPRIAGKISLGDLKRCRMTPIFFDTFFNLEKYLDHEQKDPFASQRDQDADGIETTDWNRYAAEEYELLVAEEGATEPQDDLMYDEDYELEEDELTTNLERLSFDESGVGVQPRPMAMKGNALIASDDDYADYAESDDYQY